jgi:hypothetical protein
VSPRSGKATSFTAPESFVITPHALGELRRNGVAIDRNEGVGRLAPAYFFGNPVAKLIHRFRDKITQLLPIGLFGVALVVFAFSPDSIAKASGFGAHLGVIQQFFHVAHPVGPSPEALASDRASRPGRHPSGHPIATRLLVATSALFLSRPVITFLPLLAAARIRAPKTARPLPLLALLLASTTSLSVLLALTSLLPLLPLLVLLVSTTLLALTSLLVLLVPTALQPVLLVLLLTGLRLTLTLATFFLAWALAFLARASSRLSRLSLLSLLLILTLPAFTRRILALLLLPVGTV